MSPRTVEIFLAEQELVRLGRAVLRDIPDAVIFADREGIIRFWNSGAVRIYGFDTEKALGRSLDIIIPERLRERHWAGYHQMMETGQSQHHPDELLSVPAQTNKGESISVQFTVAPVLEEDGRPAGIVASCATSRGRSWSSSVCAPAQYLTSKLECTHLQEEENSELSAAFPGTSFAIRSSNGRLPKGRAARDGLLVENRQY